MTHKATQPASTTSTSKRADRLIQKMKSTERDEEFLQYLETLMTSIFRGHTISDKQLAEVLATVDEHADSSYKGEPWEELLRPFRPDTQINRNVLAIMRHLIHNATHKLAQWDMSYDDGCYEALKAITNHHPQEARALIKRIKEDKIPVSKRLLQAIGGAITREDCDNIIPCDTEALYVMVQKFPETADFDFIKSKMRIMSKNSPRWHGDYNAQIMDWLPDHHRTAFLKEVSQHSHNPQDAPSAIIAQSAKATQEELCNALYHLYCGPAEENYHIELRTPFHLPAYLTGDDLCYMLIGLHTGVSETSRAIITGIPTPEDLSIRAIETQLGKPHTFEDAQEARDHLEDRFVPPRDLHELAAMVADAKGDPPDGFLEEKLDKLSKLKPLGKRWPLPDNITAYARLIDSASEATYIKILSVLRKRFTHKRYSLAAIIIASATSPRHLVQRAMSYLIRTYYYDKGLQLASTYNIPSDTRDDHLCTTISYLASSITLTATGRIEGLPTEDELSHRASQIRQDDKRRYEATLYWRAKIAKNTKKATDPKGKGNTIHAHKR